MSNTNPALATKEDLGSFSATVTQAISDAKAYLTRWILGVGLVQAAFLTTLCLSLRGGMSG